MRRSSKAKLSLFLDEMRHEYRRCLKRGHHERARQIRIWLAKHIELIGGRHAR